MVISLKKIYMKPHSDYSHPPSKVYKLRHALYHLKQTLRAQFVKFSGIILQHDFQSSTYNSALFVRKSAQGCVLFLLYVDDMIITGDDLLGISTSKSFLQQHFEMKDLGNLGYFLGLKVLSNSTRYYLSQAKYTSNLLVRADLTNSKTVFTLLKLNIKLQSSDSTLLSDATLYRQLVGNLVYLTITRPDIAYAVHVVSQFMAAPYTSHFAAVLYILRYFKGTLFHGLYFSACSPLVLRLMLMQIGQVILQIDGLLLNFVFSQEILFFH